MLGHGDNHDLTEYLRLYISIHGDHEGGNASAHTAREFNTHRGAVLVLHIEPHYHLQTLLGPPCPTLTCHMPRRCTRSRDPSMGMHPARPSSRADQSHSSCSLANQEVLRWQLNMRKELGDENITSEHVKEFLWRTLNSGQVVPG